MTDFFYNRAFKCHLRGVWRVVENFLDYQDPQDPYVLVHDLRQVTGAGAVENEMQCEDCPYHTYQ